MSKKQAKDKILNAIETTIEVLGCLCVAISFFRKRGSKRKPK